MLQHNHYESFAQFIATARRSLKCQRFESRRPDVKKLADEGWVVGAERSRRFVASITDAIGELIERVEINYDVEGHNIDIARFLDNEPECWQKFDVEKIQQPARKYIRLVINGSYSGGIGREVVEQRGAVAVALVELLEYAGHRVEVTMARCMNPHERRGETYLSTAVLKRFDEQVDLPKIAFALSHGDMLETYHFGETSAQTDGLFFHGMPTEIPIELRGDICLDRMKMSEPQWETPRQAVAWVKAKLKEFGVTLHENTPTQ